MELYEAMRCAPATRRFRSDPVPHEVLRRVLDAARFAPSGGNRQGWRVIAVEDENTRRALRAEDLGAALTTLLAPAEAQVKELLGIPDGVVLAAYVLAGARAERWPVQLSRRPVEEFAFAERYGQAL